MYLELKQYSKEIDELLKSERQIEQEILTQHLIKIQFFQHERQIHLFVTLFYALFLVISIFFLSIHPIFAIIPFALICFLIPYVIHYFHLENGVQYLYKQYDKLLKNRKK